MSEIVKRAGMTAIEGFCAVMVPEVCLILSSGIPTDIHAVWAYIAPVLGSAIAAGISAGWNYYLQFGGKNA